MDSDSNSKPAVLTLNRSEIGCLVGLVLFVVALALPSIINKKLLYGFEFFASSTLFSFIPIGDAMQVFAYRLGLLANVLFVLQQASVFFKVSSLKRMKRILSVASFINLGLVLLISSMSIEGLLPGFFVWLLALGVTAIVSNDD